MRNEHFAVRQKLSDVYRARLGGSQERLQQFWNERAARLQDAVVSTNPGAAFAKCVSAGLADSVVLFDQQGRVSYPNAPSAVASDFGELELKWQEAGRLEHLRRCAEAAPRYDQVARAATNANLQARAFQAEARCLVQAGQTGAAIRLINETLSAEAFRAAVDPQGRVIAANAELMALELMTNRNSPIFKTMVQRLAARIGDYENPVLAAPQRRFLMKEVEKLEIHFPTLKGEELAAEVMEARLTQPPEFVLQPSPLPGLWQFTTPNHRVLAVASVDSLLTATRAAIVEHDSVPGTELTLAPPDVEPQDAFLTLPAGRQMPGWRLALLVKDRTFLDTTTGDGAAIYLWTGMLVLGVVGVLGLTTLRLMRRQMTLARLKNELAATVSHELKTPLASMRVLVETLLAAEKFDEQTTREYLQLIAQENERLSRLIQNFLTYSRMERGKHQFHFSPMPARQIVESAVESMRPRFNAPGCRLDLEVEGDLPPIMADADALASALSNLIENAHKYSPETKHAFVRAWAENGSVVFSVKDNGIGIAARERGRIFEPFYQVDQRLSRKEGGCGLGLGIVQFITAAHHGKLTVESQPGCGSRFTISVPVAANGAGPGAKDKP